MCIPSKTIQRPLMLLKKREALCQCATKQATWSITVKQANWSRRQKWKCGREREENRNPELERQRYIGEAKENHPAYECSTLQERSVEFYKGEFNTIAETPTPLPGIMQPDTCWIDKLFLSRGGNRWLLLCRYKLLDSSWWRLITQLLS